MSTQEQDNNLTGKYVEGNKGKILALLLLMLMLAPLFYAFLKEFTMSKEAKEKRATEAAAPVTQP